MALFVLIILMVFNNITCLLGSESIKSDLLEIRPTSISGRQNIGFYKVEDTLNLTCEFKNETYLPAVNLEWTVPKKASNSQNRMVQRLVSNLLILTISNLQENDSGDYKCTAQHNGIPYIALENTVRISVKNKKKECGEAMFQCSGEICIPKRYTCDGLSDCPNGEDESPKHCGPRNPCDNKLKCPDNRCIPFTWCCELHKEPNCTIKVKHLCCTHVEKLTRDVENDLGYQYEQQRFSDMGFLQTTVYTVIGCAMAFMFIVTIIVIAICRVHVRRTLLSRCPASSRNLALGRGGNIHGNQLSGLSFYDLDVYFNRSGLNGNDLMSVNPLLVTYNINNGVQFVGRPVDPPPYCEIVTSPPKEGPPPPYVSHEDLSQERSLEGRSEQQRVREENLEIEAEVSESDALLGAAVPATVSVISSNAIDVASPGDEIGNSETFVDEGELYSGGISKNSTDTVTNSDSSHCEITVAKSGEMSKNSALDIVVLSGCGDSVVADRPETLKGGQNGEESTSSYVPSGVSDLSRGAVRKIVRVNSTDGGSCRRKGKSFPKATFNKF